MRRALTWAAWLAAAGLVLAAPAAAKGSSGSSGKSGTGHLYFYEMTAYPGGVPVSGGAWAKMTYHYDEVVDPGSASSRDPWNLSYDKKDDNPGAGHGQGKPDDDPGDPQAGPTGAQMTMITFEAHGLDAGMEYALVYLSGAAPGSTGGTWMELASGQANNGGNLNLVNNSLQTGVLHDLMVWLVPLTDYSQGAVSNAHKGDYLYGEEMLFKYYTTQ